ncbi:MAG: DNA recombination/repair protein RecA, partial [Planctomycetota bacterium]
RLMSQALRKLTGCISKSQTTVIFINQIREKIGVMYGGNPETTPGGRALKFYSSVRIDIRRIGTIKDGDIAIGNRVRATIAKNKVAAPFKKAEFDILYNTGISRAGDIIDLGVEHQIIDKSGTWFSYGELRLGQGRENSRQFIEGKPELMKEIEQAILKKIKPVLITEKAAEKASEKTKAESIPKKTEK